MGAKTGEMDARISARLDGILEFYASGRKRRESVFFYCAEPGSAAIVRSYAAAHAEGAQPVICLDVPAPSAGVKNLTAHLLDALVAKFNVETGGRRRNRLRDVYEGARRMQESGVALIIVNDVHNFVAGRGGHKILSEEFASLVAALKNTFQPPAVLVVGEGEVLDQLLMQSFNLARHFLALIPYSTTDAGRRAAESGELISRLLREATPAPKQPAQGGGERTHAPYLEIDFTASESLSRAAHQIAAQEYEAAIQSLEEHLRKAPLDLTVRLLMLDYQTSGVVKQPDALARLKEAMTLSERLPKHSHAQYLLGRVWMQCLEPQDAIKCFERALELRPDHYHARYELAKSLYASGRSAEALAEVRRLLLRDGGNFLAHRLLLTILKEQGDKQAIERHIGRLAARQPEALEGLRRSVERVGAI